MVQPVGFAGVSVVHGVAKASRLGSYIPINIVLLLICLWQM